MQSINPSSLSFVKKLLHKEDSMADCDKDGNYRIQKAL
jgi:hypothetical protein